MNDSRSTSPSSDGLTEYLEVEGSDGIFSHAWNQLRKRKLALISVCILLVLYTVGILAPLVATHDYTETNLAKTQAAPDLENWLGTDRLGRDIFSRVVWGIQTTVILTVITSLTASFVLGLAAGMAAGYLRGIVDIITTRTGEVVSVFPDILLLLIIVATVRPQFKEFGYWIEDNTFISGVISSGAIDYIVLGVAFLPLSWFGSMRLIRGQTLAIREAPYVDAARSMGVGTPKILLRHILPNVITPLIVSVSFGMGGVALGEAIISFFGVGVQPPRPSLGVMIGDVTARTGSAAVETLRNHPEQLLPPIIVVWLMIFCWNILGDALNDILNPRAR